MLPVFDAPCHDSNLSLADIIRRPFRPPHPATHPTQPTILVIDPDAALFDAPLRD